MGRQSWWATAVLCGMATLLTASVGSEEPKEGVKRALLIGINEYANTDIPDLRGAVNDIALVRQVLVRRYGFAESAITQISDVSATRAAILAALDRLVTESGPDDFVYLHYSGHGSQVDDATGDEYDRLDETLVPHDGRQPGIADITDDELFERISRLKVRGALLVFDSCHSGTISRTASDVSSRFVPPDTRTTLYPSRLTRDIRRVVETTNYTVMSGAPATQQALDGPIDGSYFGLFTYSLAQALQRAEGRASPQDLMTGIRAQLNRLQTLLNVRPPEPQLEAPDAKLKTPWLPTTVGSVARRAWVPVVKHGDHWRLPGAANVGAVRGSTWAVYPPGETRFEYGQALTRVRVERIEAADAWVSPESPAKLVEGARAIPLLAGRDEPVVTARFDATPSGQAALLGAALLRRLPDLRLVQDPQPARFIVTPEGAGWRLLDAGGLVTVARIAGRSEDEVADDIVRVLLASRRATVLASLENPASDIQLVATLVNREGALSAKIRQRRAGEPRSADNSLMLELRADRDVYVTVASVDTEGNVQLLFPNRFQRPGFLPDGWVDAGRTVRIPDSLEEGNRAGFHWDYGPPAGRDTLKVFATATPETADLIRRFITESGRDPGRLGGLSATLAQGVIRGGPSGADWFATSITVDVESSGENRVSMGEAK